jgi:hypothetical protein
MWCVLYILFHCFNFKYTKFACSMFCVGVLWDRVVWVEPFLCKLGPWGVGPTGVFWPGLGSPILGSAVVGSILLGLAYIGSEFCVVLWWTVVGCSRLFWVVVLMERAVLGSVVLESAVLGFTGVCWADPCWIPMGCSQWDVFAWALLRSSVPFLADLCSYWLFGTDLFVTRLVGFSLVCRYLYFLASVFLSENRKL